MKIEIPENILRELVLDQLPYEGCMGLERLVGNNGKSKLKDLVIKQVLKKIGKIEIPKISKEEVKDRMLDILAERALENKEEE